jgi:hypothetical protein
MNRRILIAALLATTGCAAVQKPITEDVAKSLKGKHAAAVAAETPSFTAMTAGKAMFGVFGAAAMISEGNALVAKHGVQDPAVKLSADLAQELGRKLGVSVAAPSGPAASDDIDDLATRHPNEDLVLDVRTVGWSFGYFPTDWSHYRVIYSVKARLIDVKTKEVLAEGFAQRVPDYTPDAPTYDELLASNAARLKAELNKAAKECYAELLQRTFRL